MPKVCYNIDKRNQFSNNEECNRLLCNRVQYCPICNKLKTDTEANPLEYSNIFKSFPLRRPSCPPIIDEIKMAVSSVQVNTYDYTSKHDASNVYSASYNTSPSKFRSGRSIGVSSSANASTCCCVNESEWSDSDDDETICVCDDNNRCACENDQGSSFNLFNDLPHNKPTQHLQPPNDNNSYYRSYNNVQMQDEKVMAAPSCTCKESSTLPDKYGSFEPLAMGEYIETQAQGEQFVHHETNDVPIVYYSPPPREPCPIGKCRPVKCPFCRKSKKETRDECHQPAKKKCCCWKEKKCTSSKNKHVKKYDEEEED